MQAKKSAVENGLRDAHSLDPIGRIATFELKETSFIPSSAFRVQTLELKKKEDPMLPPFIIEQIKKREEEERVRYEQPQLEMPNLPAVPGARRKDSEEKDDEPNRGVIILEL